VFAPVAAMSDEDGINALRSVKSAWWVRI